MVMGWCMDVVFSGRSKSRTAIHANGLALMNSVTGSWDIPSELDVFHLCELTPDPSSKTQ